MERPTMYLARNVGEMLVGDIEKTIVIHGRNKKGIPHATITAIVGTVYANGKWNERTRLPVKATPLAARGGTLRYDTVTEVVEVESHNRPDKVIVFGISQCKKSEDCFNKEYGRDASLKRALEMADTLRRFPGRPRERLYVTKNGMAGHATHDQLDEVLDYFYNRFKAHRRKKPQEGAQEGR